MVKIVTDSTADIPRELAQEHDIRVVPAIVNFGLESFREGVDISTSEFFARLVASPTLPTTSQPSVGEFMEAYAEAGRSGEPVLGIHLGSTFSGLFSAAQLASESMPERNVTVYDSGLLSMGLGLMVIEAAKAARKGARLEQLIRLLDSMKPRTRVIAVLDTLEYLRRGGRLSRISATLGRILSVRPVIQVFDNRLEQLARTRHRENSLRRLLEIAQAHAPFDHLVVLHAAAAEVADWLATHLSRLNSGVKPAIIEAGSVIGTHAGPGAVGFACVAKR
ncbi:MAG: DegV family protein [Anaerolineae bacterium]|nr:DegV family protein [Anaerolineae bacterium]